MRGFLNVFPEAFGLGDPSLLLKSDADFTAVLSEKLAYHAGHRRALVFHLDLYRVSHEEVDVVLAQVLVPADAPA